MLSCLLFKMPTISNYLELIEHYLKFIHFCTVDFYQIFTQLFEVICSFISSSEVLNYQQWRLPVTLKKIVLRDCQFLIIDLAICHRLPWPRRSIIRLYWHCSLLYLIISQLIDKCLGLRISWLENFLRVKHPLISINNYWYINCFLFLKKRKLMVYF